MSRRPALLLCALAGLGAERARRLRRRRVDADLLEFLGSIGEDEDWQEYPGAETRESRGRQGSEGNAEDSGEVAGYVQRSRDFQGERQVKKLVLMLVLLLSGAAVLAADDHPAPALLRRPPQASPGPASTANSSSCSTQFESRWGELPPQRQFALSRGAARWLQMNDDEARAHAIASAAGATWPNSAAH